MCTATLQVVPTTTQWSEEMDTSFYDLKRALSSAPAWDSLTTGNDFACLFVRQKVMPQKHLGAETQVSLLGHLRLGVTIAHVTLFALVYCLESTQQH